MKEKEMIRDFPAAIGGGKSVPVKLGIVFVGYLHFSEGSEEIYFFYETYLEGKIIAMRGRFNNISEFIDWARSNLGTPNSKLKQALTSVGLII